MVRLKRESGARAESLKPIEDAADRFERDNEAAVRARAAANVYDQSKRLNACPTFPEIPKS